MKYHLFFLEMILFFNFSASYANELNTFDFNDPGYCFEMEDCIGTPVIDALTTRKNCIEQPKSRSWWNSNKGECINL